jgi:hypothetical protein
MAQVQEVAMATLKDSDRQNRIVWAVVAVLGAALAVVGWFRWIW